MLLKTAVDEFLQAARADGLAPATVKWYGACLKPLQATFSGRDLTSITPQDMRALIITTRGRQTAYSDRKSKQELSAESVRTYLTAWFRFWSWCAKEYGIPDPCGNIRKPKQSNAKPRGISQADFDALMKSTATGDKEHGVRDRAIILFLLDTGARAGGLVGLNWSDVDLVARRAKVTEKGEKERIVYFCEETATALRQWRVMHPAKCPEVFCSLQHGAAYGRALNYDGLHNLIAKRAKEAGCTGKISPHKFRHESARRFIQNGGDLSVLKQVMGHTDIRTTVKYAVFNEAEIAESHDKHNPLKRRDK